MNKQDIIRMALEAGINEATSEFYCDGLGRMLAAAVEQERKEFAVHAIDIARKAIEEERESCAKVCERWWNEMARDCAAAIRERSANAGVRGSAT
jgi:hypothetical protein